MLMCRKELLLNMKTPKYFQQGIGLHALDLLTREIERKNDIY